MAAMTTGIDVLAVSDVVLAIRRFGPGSPETRSIIITSMWTIEIIRVALEVQWWPLLQLSPGSGLNVLRIQAPFAIWIVRLKKKSSIPADHSALVVTWLHFTAVKCIDASTFYFTSLYIPLLVVRDEQEEWRHIGPHVTSNTAELKINDSSLCYSRLFD